LPEKFAGHSQKKPPPAGMSLQVPLFKHGWYRHSFLSTLQSEPAQCDGHTQDHVSLLQVPLFLQSQLIRISQFSPV
jgi:hypothetical protein